MTTTPDGRSILDVVLTNPTTGLPYSAAGGGGGTSYTETLWTDDTGAFYVRIDTGPSTAPVWNTPTGTLIASFTPGANLRPAAGASILLDASRYQATALRSSDIALGDFLSHITTVDPATGAVLANFWVNSTQSTKLATPPSALNITPISPLPANAAQETSGNLASIAANISTAANQTTANTALSNISTAAGTPTDTAYVSGSGSTIALLKALFSKLMGSIAVTLPDNSTGSATVSASGILTGFPASTAGYSKLYVYVVSSTLTGVVNFEGSNDGFVNVAQVLGFQIGASYTPYTSINAIGNPSAGCIFEIPLTHAQIRLRCSTWTSGTAVFQWNFKSAGAFKNSADQGAPVSTTASSWLFKIMDGTNGPAAVKPASTPPAATDPALVAALSPNSAGIAPSAVTTVTTNASTTILSTATAGYNRLVVAIMTTIAGATITFQGSPDGTTWNSVQATRIDYLSNAPAYGAVSGTYLAAGVIYSVPSDLPYLRLIASASGWTGSVQWQLVNAPSNHLTVDQGAANSAPWNVSAIHSASSANSYMTQYPALVQLATLTAYNQIKGSAGRLYKITVENSDTVPVWLKMANATSGTPGTLAATSNYIVPAGQSRTIDFADIGDYFSTGIIYYVSKGIALNDATVPTANTVVVNARYA